MNLTPYTNEERQEISANILRYMQRGKVERYETRLLSGTESDILTERDATPYDIAMMEIVALDVLGHIERDSIPASINPDRHKFRLCHISQGNR